MVDLRYGLTPQHKLSECYLLVHFLTSSFLCRRDDSQW